MSMAYLAQPDEQQKLEWLDGEVFSVLLDGAATDGQLTVGRFTVSKSETPSYYMHTREDEVFILIKGIVLVWSETTNGTVLVRHRLPARERPHGYRITSDTADLLLICT